MVEFKIVVSYPDGKAETVIAKDKVATQLIGMKIGDVFDGSLIEKPGFEMVITGGSDSAGFPMVPFIQGGALIRVLLRDKNGIARRVYRRGSLITESIVQINVKAKKKVEPNGN
jgi:small subunit ribosomal protein S6e